MINTIVSSVRPFGQDPAFAAFQREAIASWTHCANGIILLNDRSDVDEDTAKMVHFIPPDQNPPTIHALVTAGLLSTPAGGCFALVNADIVLLPKLAEIPELVEVKHRSGKWGVTSRRWYYEPNRGREKVALMDRDQGLDFFCASKRMWEELDKELPRFLTLGRNLWDNWVNSWFQANRHKDVYYTATYLRAVLHPIHGGRGRHPEYERKDVDSLRYPHPGGPPTRILPRRSP